MEELSMDEGAMEELSMDEEVMVTGGVRCRDDQLTLTVTGNSGWDGSSCDP
ncbi:hypothetical protein [Pseudoxanthomonas koreensis]|uniref:hypothetical protein n=1 Tax=Pseudoxanthomonas koreensis TaxID=266061 RepID=UPI0035A65612